MTKAPFMLRCTLSFLTASSLFACMDSTQSGPTSPTPDSPLGFGVGARGETAPSSGDPDDIAIWLAPDDPANSLIIGTDKSGGIMLYELDGSLRQDLRDGVMNNVDLRMDVALGDQFGTTALIASSNRTDDAIDLYTIDLGTRMLVRLAAVPSDIGEPYGLCMYRSPHDERTYVLIDNKQGQLAQYQVVLDMPGAPSLTLARTVMLGGQLEGCVADDELARLYVGEEDLGIWRLAAEPDTDDEPMLIHDVDDPYLTADVEGLTIYYAADGQGYLIASSQGDNSYALFERGGDNAYLGSFRVVAGAVDAAVESDGIDVTNLPLGPLWPDGLFIAHDDHNEDFTRNFKLVGWGDIVAAADVDLLVDTEHRVGP